MSRLQILIAGGMTVVALAVVLILRNENDAPPDVERGVERGVHDDVRTSSRGRPSSPFLNTADGELVGSAACATCHAEEAQSFAKTGMGDSFGVIDVAHAPPDADVVHAASRRRYEVRRAGQTLQHRELSLSDMSDPVELADVKLAWRIGSGRHASSFLAERDGFLVESPLTWYASRQAWDMSPGYDQPRHDGFSRPIDMTCLKCHTGQAEPVDGTLHRIRFLEPCISCERCHGPGSLHVDRHGSATNAIQTTSSAGHAADGNSAAVVDHTIVNPRHLDRELADDICSACHHQPLATVAVPGTATVPRTAAAQGFRPGLPLSAFRVDFDYRAASGTMTVAGHVGQLRQSACYQNTDLSCLTCHHPHPTQATDPVRHYRSVCLSCHDHSACGQPEQQRRAVTADDSCVVCHMPTADTEIAHVAFTHHRIGVHASDGSPTGKAAPRHSELPADAQPDDIVVTSDIAALTPSELQAARGMALMQIGKRLSRPLQQEAFGRTAHQQLRAAWLSGHRDPEAAARLALLAQSFDPAATRQYAEAALKVPGLSPQARVDSLLAMSGYAAETGDLQSALRFTAELTVMRREASDHVLRGRLLLNTGDVAQAVAAFQQALKIDSTLQPVRQWLIDHNQQAPGN